MRIIINLTNKMNSNSLNNYKDNSNKTNFINKSMMAMIKSSEIGLMVYYKDKLKSTIIMETILRILFLLSRGIFEKGYKISGKMIFNDQA